MKPSPLLATSAAVALLLTGCGSGAGDDGRPDVVASFYPLQYVAERVVGEHAKVTNLTAPGAEPHDLELTVQQTADVAGSDLVLYEQGLQPVVDEAVEQNGPDEVVDVTDVVELKPVDHHEDDGEEDHEGHDHGDVDPHFWLDPNRMATVAAAVADRMAEVDPAHEDAYRANADRLRRDLDRLDQEYTKGLADCRLDTVVVSHDAFGYLSRYGLHFEAINGLSPDAEPSSEHIAEIHDVAEAEGITTVFSETLASAQMAESIASDLGLETAVLDPVEGLGDRASGEDYLSLMRANLAALRKANGCS